MLEKTGQRKILVRLRERGAWTVKVITCNQPGTPDILAAVPMTLKEIKALFRRQKKVAVFAGLEVKRINGGVTSRLQQRQLRKIREAGGLAGVVRTYDDVERLIKEGIYEDA